MSAGFLGGLAGLGPGLQEGMEGKQRIAASKAGVTVMEAREGRERDKHKWASGLSERMKMREFVDGDPVKWEQYNTFMQGGGPVAPVQPQPINTPQAQAQQAVPAIGHIQNMAPPQQVQVPGMAEGGPVQVPDPQPMQPQQPAALPANPAEQARAQQGTTTPSRRERYNQWYADTAKYAVLTGGLEGYQKFQEMEDALSRRQVMGYGLQAVRMLDEGNVGEAMRAGNAALEVTPFDTGLKFVASDGKLHIQGRDGTLGEPLNSKQMAAFVDDHMKTPEAYLDWKAQYETERSAKVGEKLRGREIDVSEYNAETSRRQVDTWVDESDSRIYAREAGAYRDIASGRAALDNAYYNSLPDDDEGWTTSNLRSMEKDITAAIQEGQLGFNEAWATEAMIDSPVYSMAANYTKDIRRINPPSAMSDDLAAALVRTSLMDFMKDPQGEPLVKDARVGQDEDTGHWVVSIAGGNPIILPEQVALSLNRNLALNEQKLANSRREK